MKVFIASSANKEIDNKYIEFAKEASEVLAKNNFDLFFGAANYSMMGACYKTFIKYNRKVYAYTVPRYEKDFKALIKAKCYKVNDTLSRFKKLYFKSDIILILPGGIGTLAEFASAIEEYRASFGNKKIILANYDGYYDGLIKWMNDNVETGFFKKDLFNSYEIINNVNELENIVNDYIKDLKQNREE